MSDSTLEAESLSTGAERGVAEQVSRLHPAAGYAAGIGLVALATGAAFIVEALVPASNLTLVFVLPVLLAALGFGWGPALVSAVTAVAAFDFFFTAPRQTFRVDSASDIWAMSLLLVVAAITSAVAATSRRRALAAEEAARRAEALHRLAHLVVDGGTGTAVSAAAAEALTQIFHAPAVVLLERGDRLETMAVAGAATLSPADHQAAQWALDNKLPTRGETFPFDTAEFDFWPIRRGAGAGVVLGVGLVAGREDHLVKPTRYVEMVGAYLAAGLSQEPRPTRGA